MIKVAHILPTDYLMWAERHLSKIHLVLAHRVLNDPVYTDLYVRRRRQGDYIILDNSAFELGSAIDDTMLLRAVELLQPDELVLPDVLYDSYETLSRATDFLQKRGDLLGTDLRFMAVPHGKNLHEYVVCYQKLSSMPEVHALGIGTIYNKLFAAEQPGQGRAVIFQALERENFMSSKPHHLLGLGDSGHLELSRLKQYGQIRSCDSSAAYIHAKEGRRLYSGRTYRKSPNKINLGDAYEEGLVDCIAANMNVISEAAL